MTSDKRTLRGYVIRSKKPAIGYLLFVQGNAMLAKGMLADIRFLEELNLDIYILDFRGYGRSNGKPTMKAIFNDYSEIVSKLNTEKYEKRFYYGVSLGGIVLMNVLRGKQYDGLVIDGTLAVLSSYFCPESRDPIRNVPSDARKIVAIVGTQDKVISIENSEPLADLVRKNKGEKIKRNDFGHPFDDGRNSQRKELVLSVFKKLLQ